MFGEPITSLAVAGELLIRLIVVIRILVRRNGQPSARLAWIVVVMLVPVAGPLLYLMVGEVRLGRRRLRLHTMLREHQREVLGVPHEDHPAALAPDYAPIAALAQSVGGTRARRGNQIRLISDSAALIDALVGDIDTAHLHCHLLSYIYLPDASGHAVAEALIRAARRGVPCRLLVDAIGSKAFLASPLRRHLDQAGVEVVASLPVSPLRALLARMDIRNHRKLAVIDGVIAYAGSQNIADAAFAPKARYAPWVDASVRIRGPVAWDLQRLFVEDWFLDSREWLGEVLSIRPEPELGGIDAQIIGTGPMSYNYAMRQVQQAALHLAREEVVITSPYLVPDEGTIASIHATARCGTRMRLVVPARNDSRMVAAASRSFYADLLESGVEILEYRRGLLHAKTLTVDGRLSILGSANLDRRSFEINFEVSVIVYSEPFTQELRALQGRYMVDAGAVDPARWLRLSWPRRLYYNTAGLLGALL
ncbi:cardiolipin synthase [Acidihalobacter yilgarnensis]|uniref:Cardiolipin synthase n=1 Tax=Acidihalobacter yilgarnensis TaxID=2819280 RepID=A0A1D8IRJ2_9GAMM|nr:cardiolipin synthase [Acidihalobacter yilgarnensis]AOU99099.1 cardiolipin synthase [Acidihalobacter yilgarnensis]